MWHWFAGDVIHSPLYLWQELCLEDAPGLQRLGDLSPEEEAPLGQINQNLPDDLAEVHAAAHLLISAMFKSETKLKISLGLRYVRSMSCILTLWLFDLCLPSLSEFSSTAWSYFVLMSSRQPLSPNAPHSILTHMRPSFPSTISMFLISSM